MTKKLSECPYCKRPADERGGINHVGGCTGLQTVSMNRLQYDGLQDEIKRQRAEIRSLDQANGGALREIERLTRDMVALQSQWDDMQQGFVEVFGEPVRDAIELLGATERLRAEIERLRAEVEAWQKTAAEFHRGMEYYRGLLDKIGETIGDEAYVADDGSVSDDVLRAKVPEIIERLRTYNVAQGTLLLSIQQENERLRSELAVSRRLRSAHNAVVDSLFAHQEAGTQPNEEEKDRLMAEWQEAERAFKAEVISDEPVKP